MPNYLRVYQKGGCYFFTVVTKNRQPIFSSSFAIQVLKNAFNECKRELPFTIDAMVILPDHLHCICHKLPDFFRIINSL